MKQLIILAINSTKYNYSFFTKLVSWFREKTMLYDSLKAIAQTHAPKK